jgi:hypothetical protein
MAMKKGVLAQQANDEADEDPNEEATETPDQESAEDQQEGDDDSAPPDAGAQGGQLDPKVVELFNLVVARTMQALTKVAPGLDAALKADPVQGAVKFGVQALRTVVMAAQKAGKSIPFEVVLNAGMQVIKEIAGIANDKGYLPDNQIETFLKEVLQQSIAQYAQLDAKDGVLSQGQLAQLQQRMGMGVPAPKGALAQASAQPDQQDNAQGA